MAVNLVWNPVFEGNTLARITEQLQTFYPRSFAQFERMLMEQKGQRLQSVCQMLADYLRSNSQEIVVSPEVYQRLLQANQAIAAVKALLPFGAGNQLEAWCLTHGNAKQRKDQGKAVAKFGQQEREIIKGTRISTGSAALVSRVTQGATCREYAALTYEYLREQNVPAQNITIWSMKTGDHVLILVGDLTSPEQVVAVDAWPTHAQAVRWTEHFAYGSELGKGTLEAGLAQPLNMPEINDLAGRLIQTNDQLQLMIMNFVPCCTASFGQITYTMSNQSLSQLYTNASPPLPNLEEERARLQNFR